MCTKNQTFAFKCPVHGVATKKFCWRAFMPKYSTCWFKIETETRRVPFDEDELDNYLGDLKSGASCYEY